MRRTKKMYENYVCPTCLNQLNKCTCEQFPPWHLLMIDYKLQEHIRLLNQKGYSTKACCEGHEYSKDLYIAFHYPEKELKKITLPDGFFWAVNGIHCSLSNYSEELKDKKLEELMSWIKDLPEKRKR